MCLGTLLFSPAESWLEGQHPIEAVTQAEIEMSFRERFPDPHLAHAVYLELYPEKTLFPERVNLEAPVSAEQLATIITLADTPERPITDLTGIQQLSHLKTLHAEGNEGGRIQQLAPLASIKNLEHLTLRNEFIQDLTPLAKLTQLQSLDLSMNRITSVQALQGLTQLQTLRLTGNQVTDFRPLKALPAIQAKDATYFEAFAQTIQAEETKTTGETSQLSVYTPEGEKIPATVASSQGEVQVEDGVKWLQPGDQQIQYQVTEGQIVAFLQQEVVGPGLESVSKQKRSRNWNASSIIVYNALGEMIDDSSYDLVPEDDDDSKLDNSLAITGAINLASKQSENSNHQRGKIQLPEGKWHILRKIGLKEGVMLEGHATTTLYRKVGDFSQESIAHTDGVRYYDAMIDMRSNTMVRNLILDGLQSPDEAVVSIQGGITAKGNYGEGPNLHAPTASDYLQNLTIEDVTVQNMAGSGITIDLAKNVTIRGTTPVTAPNHAMKVENVKNDGIIGYSVENMRVENTLTRTIGHNINGADGKNYNICATMRKMGHPDPGLAYYVRYPNSRDVTFQHNVVLDNPYWEGLDG
ncbi:leucine-rich repeat domain-containing protein, partial [Listeria booriae]|uniref:leucine-rich repeat domain-containing protein n=1 Tax=Listeria booriae TaxID=1552123 RepID=UPI001625B84E